MAILTRYIVRIFLRNFFLALGSFAGIFLLIEFFEKVDKFVDKDLPLVLYLSYFINGLPLIINQTAPLAILMASFSTIGSLTRTGELTAMRAGGLSLYRISRPLILTTCFITILLIGSQEMIVPESAGTMNRIMEQNIKSKEQAQRIKNKIWVRSGNSIVHIEQAIPHDGTLQEITMYRLDEDFQLAERIDAGSAHFENNGWLFRNLTQRKFNTETGSMTASDRHASQQLDFNKKPEDFQRSDPHEWGLSFSELRKLARSMKAEGYDNTRILVDMHSHISAPFACIVMVLLGIPFALNRGRNTSLSFGIIVSVVVGVIYFMLHSVAMAFGYSGVLPPILATWSANILVGLTGLWLVLFRSQ